MKVFLILPIIVLLMHSGHLFGTFAHKSMHDVFNDFELKFNFTISSIEFVIASCILIALVAS